MTSSSTTHIDQIPGFLDPLNGDYSLDPNASSTPCIDTATNRPTQNFPSGTLRTDFEGDDRKLDGDGDTTATLDMGADEYAP